MGSWAISQRQSNQCMVLTTHPHLVSKLGMSRGIPPLPLCALKASYREIITFTVNKTTFKMKAELR
jgi:hypothetical protein